MKNWYYSRVEGLIETNNIWIDRASWDLHFIRCNLGSNSYHSHRKLKRGNFRLLFLRYPPCVVTPYAWDMWTLEQNMLHHRILHALTSFSIINNHWLVSIYVSKISVQKHHKNPKNARFWVLYALYLRTGCPQKILTIKRHCSRPVAFIWCITIRPTPNRSTCTRG